MPASVVLEQRRQHQDQCWVGASFSGHGDWRSHLNSGPQQEITQWKAPWAVMSNCKPSPNSQNLFAGRWFIRRCPQERKLTISFENEVIVMPLEKFMFFCCFFFFPIKTVKHISLLGTVKHISLPRNVVLLQFILCLGVSYTNSSVYSDQIKKG